MTSPGQPTGPTLDELLAAMTGAEQEYQRLNERVYLYAERILVQRGRESLPAQLVQAIDAAHDAREAWFRRVDEVCRRLQ